MKSDCTNPISALSSALRLENGTVEQVSERIGLTPEQVENLNEHLLWGDSPNHNFGDFTDCTLEWTRGLLAQKTVNVILREQTYKEEKSNVFFWRGVMDGQWKDDQKLKLRKATSVSVKVEE